MASASSRSPSMTADGAPCRQPLQPPHYREYRNDGGWSRRQDTSCLRTKADPTGRKLWGTSTTAPVATRRGAPISPAEENCHGYFWTDQRTAEGKRRNKGLGGERQKSHERYGIPSNWYSWGRYQERFNIDKEAQRVPSLQLDRRDRSIRSRTSTPVKHTALGRFRHEGRGDDRQQGRSRGPLLR